MFVQEYTNYFHRFELQIIIQEIVQRPKTCPISDTYSKSGNTNPNRHSYEGQSSLNLNHAETVMILTNKILRVI